MLVNSVWKSRTLKNMRFVPHSQQNNFSSMSALDDGLSQYSNNIGRLFKNQDGEIAAGFRKQLYELMMRVVIPEKVCMVVSRNSPKNELHEIFGYQNNRLTKMSN